MSAVKKPQPSWRRFWRSPVRLFTVVMFAIGVFAPFLANDVPLVARSAGNWSFPAFADGFGIATPGPNGMAWKRWWARIEPDSDDFAIMPPWPYGPGEADPVYSGAGPSFAHPLGNDAEGRDLVARIVHGTRTALCIGGIAVLLAAAIGTVLGAAAGYRRGILDIVVLRLIEIFLCFPGLLFLLFAASFFGDSRIGLVLVMASLFWTSFARIVRGEMLSLRERDFVLVARQLGIGERRLVLRHLLPQLRSQVGVTAAFCMAAAIVAESTLSFLGLGPGEAASSWGHTLRQGSAEAHLGRWHEWLFPTVTIVATVVCCHVLADQMRTRRPA